MPCLKCKINKKLLKTSQVTAIYRTEPFENGLCKTPPMGWNSWNYFKENINEKMLLEMAKAIKESGLLEAGYTYLNLDDYWEADRRDEDGKLECDLVKFPKGMRHFVEEVNKLGFKAGIYSSNGTLTCQSLPASLGNEYRDALQFAKWGIEYLKYDFCYHKYSSQIGPELFAVTVTEKGTDEEIVIPAKDASLSGTARLTEGPCRYHPEKNKVVPFIKGLDANRGMATFRFVAPREGEYVITLDTRYPFSHSTLKEEFMAAIRVGDGEPYFIEPGPINHPCRVAPFRVVAKLQKGQNLIHVFNPIGSRADSSMLNYMTMSDALKKAVKTYTEETGEKRNPIAFSVCEWGSNKPWEWGSTVANLWRTTGDIGWTWRSIWDLYEKNVVLYKYASVGHWNDPDMLEVGNGDLTLDENRTHFTLWCMMASPLLLGNDIVNMKPEHLAILKNKNLIDIDQDALGKQAKRISGLKRRQKGIDVLVRPLADGSIALCAVNKGKKPLEFSFDLSALQEEEYVKDYAKKSYTAVNLWEETSEENVTKLSANISSHAVKIWKLK